MFNKIFSILTLKWSQLKIARRGSHAITNCLETNDNPASVAQQQQETMDISGYSPRKAAQIIAYFAMKASTGSIDLLKAIKLVYLADRENIRRWGEPLLNEPRYSLPRGPVNHLTLAFAKGDRQDAEDWSPFLKDAEKDDKAGTLTVTDGLEADDLDELSVANIQSLDHVWAQVGYMNGFVLADWTHKDNNVPEWTDPNGSRLPITLESMMKEMGVSDPKAAAARFEGHRSISQILGET